MSKRNVDGLNLTIVPFYSLVAWIEIGFAVIVNVPKLCKIHKWFRQNALIFQQRSVDAIAGSQFVAILDRVKAAGQEDAIVFVPDLFPFCQSDAWLISSRFIVPESDVAFGGDQRIVHHN